MKMLVGLRSSVLVGLLSTLAVSVSASAADLLIEAYGDSTTLGISCVDHQCGPRPENAVTFLQDKLRAKHGDGVVVTNLGVGGTTATQLDAGNDRRGGKPWVDRLSQSHARIVTINYGINEVMHNQTPQQFYDAETTLVKAALASGKLPVLETANPMLDRRLNARLADMVAMTRRVAEEQHVPLVDQFASISSLPDWQHAMSDGAHPSASLYKLKAGFDFAVLDPIVARLLKTGS
jgi:acyl-CoA thioesterase I